jgi:hypothetical protein
MARFYQQCEEACLMTRTVTNSLNLMQKSEGSCMQNLCNTGVLSYCETVHNFRPVEQLLLNTRPAVTKIGIKCKLHMNKVVGT